MSTQRPLFKCLQVAALGLVGFVPMAPAQAGVCADGDTCQFLFSNTNHIGVTIDIEVVINNLAPNTQITVNYLSDNITNVAKPIGITAELGLRPHLARTQRAWGEALRAAGLATEAEPHLQKAATLFDELGLDAEAKAVRAGLAMGETKLAFD